MSAVSQASTVAVLGPPPARTSLLLEEKGRRTLERAVWMSSHTNAHAWGTEACRLMSPLDTRKEDEGKAKAAGTKEARRISVSARGKEQTGKRAGD